MSILRLLREPPRVDNGIPSAAKYSGFRVLGTLF